MPQNAFHAEVLESIGRSQFACYSTRSHNAGPLSRHPTGKDRALPKQDVRFRMGSDGQFPITRTKRALIV
jgi:hypothetical protein